MGRLFEARMAPNEVLKILVRIFARNRDEKRGRSHLVENAYTVRRFFARPTEALTYILYIIVKVGLSNNRRPSFGRGRNAAIRHGRRPFGHQWV